MERSSLWCTSPTYLAKCDIFLAAYDSALEILSVTFIASYIGFVLILQIAVHSKYLMNKTILRKLFLP